MFYFFRSGKYVTISFMLINDYRDTVGVYAEKVLIIIRGTASSGKSSVCELLIEKPSIPFILFSMEDMLFFHMLPKKYLVDGSHSKEGYGIERNSKGHIEKVYASEWGQKIYLLHQSTLENYTRSGINIICDGNFCHKESLLALLDYVPDDYKIYLFSISAPLEVLETREKQRGKERVPGFARHQKVSSDALNYVDDLTVHIDAFTSVLDISNQIFTFYETHEGTSKVSLMEKIKNY